jgi:hypothetical protein
MRSEFHDNFHPRGESWAAAHCIPSAAAAAAAALKHYHHHHHASLLK